MAGDDRRPIVADLGFSDQEHDLYPFRIPTSPSYTLSMQRHSIPRYVPNLQIDMPFPHGDKSDIPLVEIGNGSHQSAHKQLTRFNLKSQ